MRWRRLFQCPKQLAPTAGHQCIRGRFHPGVHYWTNGESSVLVGNGGWHS